MAELTKQALKVANNTEFPNNNNGAITPSNLRGFNLDMIDSTVNQAQYTTDSGSWNQQIDALESFSGSTAVSITNLNASSASQQISIDALNVFTASASGLSTGSLLVTASAVSNVITFTKGDASTFNVTVADTTNLTPLNTFTASAAISITNLNASSASQQISINNLNTNSASVNTSINNLNASSASQQVSINNLNTNSASVNTSINNLNASSASQQVSINALNSFTSSQSTASLVTSIDNLNASSASQQISINNLNAFSASASGLNTGSLLITASAISNVITFTKGDASTFNVTVADTTDLSSLNAFTASAAISITNLNASSASQQVSINALNSFTASQSTASLVTSINNLNQFSASALVSISNINSTTASLNTSITNLNSATASLFTSVNNINSTTASLNTSVGSLNLFTSSTNTSIVNINSATQSLFTSASLALVTASFNNGTRNLTFTKGDASTFTVNIPDVSGSAGDFVTTASFNAYTQSTDSSISQLNASTASQQISIDALNTFSASAEISIANLNAATSSYITSAQTSSMTVLSASFAISSSHSEFADDATNSLYAQNTITTGKNLHNATIAKGTPLYFTGSGTSGNLVGVYPADAGNPSRMPAGGIAGESIAVGDEGIVLLDGYIGGVNTTAFASGDEIFVAVGGGYTNVAPTGSAEIQFLGNVEKSDINGSGVIQMMGEARGLPNIQQGYAWVGDVNSVPQAVATSSFGGGGTINTASFATTGSNTFTGQQNIQNTLVIEEPGNPLIYTQFYQNGIDGKLYINQSGASGVRFDNVNVTMSELTASLQEGYVWVGNSTGTSTTVATSSFGGGGTINTGSFATTGSNTFTGDQTVLGDIRISGSTDNHLFINRPGGSDILRLGVSNNGNTFDFHITGSADQQLWLIDNQGGTWGNAFFGFNQLEGRTTVNAPFTASQGAQINGGDLRVAGNLTASLQQGYVWVGNASGVSTTVATSSFGGGGSGAGFPFTGDAVITGSLLVSGSSTNDLTVVGAMTITGSTAAARTTIDSGSIRVTNSPFFSLINPGNGIFSGFGGTQFQQIALENDEGTIILSIDANGSYIRDYNPTLGDYSNAIKFQPFSNYGNGQVQVLRPLEVSGNTTITGSLTISGSSESDLTIQGRQLITGPNSGQTPRLFISSSDSTNEIGRGNISMTGISTFEPFMNISSSLYRTRVTPREYQILKAGFDYPTFFASYTAQSSSVLLNYTDNLSATASYNLGVFDNAFTQDVELYIDTTTTNGVQFKDIDSSTGAYITFLKIAPNGGTNPPLEFKRAVQVTGSVSVSDVLQLAQKNPLPSGADGQLAVSGSNLYFFSGSAWNRVAFA